jgi:cytochrome c-type biogenesis protein CcmH
LNPNWIFYGLALALVVLVLFVLLRALRVAQQSADGTERLTQSNAKVYREQLAELERDLAQGLVSQAEFDDARADIEQRLLQDVRDDVAVPGVQSSPQWVRATWAGLVLLVPAVSLSLYAWVGQPAALDPQVRAQGLGQEEVSAEKIEKMGRELRARLDKNPDQAEEWVMLSRIERALDRLDAAQQALARALKLSYNPDWAIERAELLASRDQGRFQGEPWQLIESVLKADPNHLGALLLAGSAAYSESRYRDALSYWERASVWVPAQSSDRPALDAALREARMQLGLPDPQAREMAATAIRGRVSLSDEGRQKFKAEDTVFIFATPLDARMPLAVLRIKVSDLPYDFVLDDSLAMSPQARLSGADQVVVRARISRSGQAQAQPDDWGAERSGVKPGARGLNLVIDKPLQP